MLALETLTPLTGAVEQAYTDARDRIDALRARLDEALAAHENRPANWGLVGDIKHVATILAEAVTFLGGAQ